jgi:hypothetical protein
MSAPVITLADLRRKQSAEHAAFLAAIHAASRR